MFLQLVGNKAPAGVFASSLSGYCLMIIFPEMVFGLSWERNGATNPSPPLRQAGGKTEQSHHIPSTFYLALLPAQIPLSLSLSLYIVGWTENGATIPLSVELNVERSKYLPLLLVKPDVHQRNRLSLDPMPPRRSCVFARSHGPYPIPRMC